MIDQGERRYEKYARRLELLLERFPHPERNRPWRGSEIEEATGGVVSQAYFSYLRNGRYERPGIEQLAAIAKVMGFPLELWVVEEDRLPDVPGADGHPGYLFAADETLAEKFEVVWKAVVDPETGQPFSDEEIALRSKGRLEPQDVANIREGRSENLTYTHIHALSEVFPVGAEYWLNSHNGRRPLLDPETLHALEDEDNQRLLCKVKNLAPAHKNMMLLLADQLAALEEGAQELES